MDKIIAALEKVVGLVKRPGTDVSWSRYRDAEDALADLNKHLAKLRGGDHSSMTELKSLFAPTGALQEISNSSGWGTAYLSIAILFDEALAKLQLH